MLSGLCGAKSTFLLMVSLLIRARFDAIVLVDPVEQSIVDWLLGVGELELVFAHLSEHRCLAQCVDENSVRRDATFSESLLELVHCERISFQSLSEDVDCPDMISGYKCVFSHDLVLLFRVEFTVESYFQLVDYLIIEVEVASLEVLADELSALEVRENLIDARKHIANNVVFIRLNSDFMWLFGILARSRRLLGRFVVVHCDDGCDRFTTYLHSVYPCLGFILGSRKRNMRFLRLQIQLQLFTLSIKPFYLGECYCPSH